MQDTLTYTLRAILPILFNVMLGYIVKQTRLWTEDFFGKLNQLCFKVFLPIQICYNIYDVDSIIAVNWRVIIFLLLSVIACAFLGLLVATVFKLVPQQKGVIIQAAFRSNQAILGLPLVSALGGSAAMPLASLTTAFLIPLYNVLAIFVLSSHSNAFRCSRHERIGRVFFNPLIIGAATGLLFLLLRFSLPTVNGQPIFMIKTHLPSLYQFMTSVSSIASPMMLFVLGTQFDFSAVRRLFPQISLGVFLRLVVSPVITIGLAMIARDYLNLTLLEMPTLISTSAGPVAVSSVVMAREFLGDYQLASQLVVWSSLLSIVSIFIIVYFLRLYSFL